VERLVQALDHPDIDCYVHVDAKSAIGPFVHLENRERTFLINHRTKVYWGQYSLVQATLNAIREVLHRGKYDYVNVLSAQDFPLRPAADFHAFLEANQGQEFITCLTADDKVDWWADAARHVGRYNFHNWNIPGKYRLEQLANKLLPPRKFPIKGYVIAGWSNWFTITAASAGYLLDFLDMHPEVVRFFKYVWGADEFIFSTVIYNSPYTAHVRENLLYLDWTEGKANPKVLTVADLDVLIHSEKWFARKFDADIDSAVLDRLEAHMSEGLKA